MAEEEVVKSTVVELMIRAIDQMTQPLEDAESALTGFIHSTYELGTSIGELYGVKEGLNSVVEPAAAMQEAMTELSIATGLTSEELDKFKEKAEDLSVTYGVGAEDMVAAQTKFYKTVGDSTKALEASDIVAQFAMDTHKSATQAANELGTAYNTLGDKTKPFAQELENIASKLILLEKHYNLTELSGRRLQMLSTQAHQFNLPIDQMLALTAVMSQQGGEGQRAASIAREAINTMFKGGKEGFAHDWATAGLSIGKDFAENEINLLATVADAYKNHHEQFEQFVQAHGQAGATLQLVAENTDKMLAAERQLEDTDWLNDATLKRLQDFNVQMADLKNSTNNIKDALGSPLLDYLKPYIEDLKVSLKEINNFLKEHPLFTQLVDFAFLALAGVIALAGGLTILVAALRMVGEQMNMMTVLGEGLVPPWIRAIAVIGAIGILVYQHWDFIVKTFADAIKAIRYWMSQFVKDLLHPIDTIRSMFSDVKTSFDDNVSPIGSDLEHLWDWAKANPWTAFTGVITGLVLLRQAFMALKVVVDGFRVALNFASKATVIFEALSSPLVASLIGAALVIGALTYVIYENWATIKNWATWIKDNVVAVWDAVTDSISKATKALSDFFGAHNVGPAPGAPTTGGGGEEYFNPFILGSYVPAVPGGVPAPHPAGSPGLFRNAGYAPAGSNSVSYSNNNTFHITSNNPEETKEQMTSLMDDLQEKFRRFLEEHQLNDRRGAFDDLAYNT